MPSLADVVANREDLALRIEQELEIHFIDDLRRLLRDLRQPRRYGLRGFSGSLHRPGQLIDFRKRGIPRRIVLHIKLITQRGEFNQDRVTSLDDICERGNRVQLSGNYIAGDAGDRVGFREN